MANSSASIDLETDDRFQKHEWQIQRVGWILWGCVIVAGLLGLLGPGLFSKTRSAASDSSLSIAYDRFVHYHHPREVKLHFDLGAIGASEFRISIDRGLLNSVDIQRIVPEPKQYAISQGGVVFTFDKEPQLQKGEVTLRIDYQHQGRVRGEIGLVGHVPAQITQFVFP